MAVMRVPIDTSDAKDALPPGEEILYSTMCNCSCVFMSTSQRTTYAWTSHVVLTARGFAFIEPDFSQPPPKQGFNDWWNLYISSKHGTSNTYSTPAKLQYIAWWEVTELKPINDTVARLFSMPYTFGFAGFSNETPEQMKEHCTRFILDFLPLIIAEKQKWVEQNKDNKEISGLRRKMLISIWKRMIAFQGKFAARVEKEKIKAEKAKLKAMKA